MCQYCSVKLYASIIWADKTSQYVKIIDTYWGQDCTLFHDWNYDDNLMFTGHRYHSEPTKEGYADFFQWREKFKRPFYMGEGGHDPNKWIKSFCTMLNKENMGWTLWPYKKIKSLESLNAPVYFEAPEDWKLVRDFIKSDRSTFKAIRENRPDQQKARAALSELTESMKFRNCIIDKGYIKAMGMKP